MTLHRGGGPGGLAPAVTSRHAFHRVPPVGRYQQNDLRRRRRRADGDAREAVVSPSSTSSVTRFRGGARISHPRAAYVDMSVMGVVT